MLPLIKCQLLVLYNILYICHKLHFFVFNSIKKKNHDCTEMWKVHVMALQCKMYTIAKEKKKSAFRCTWSTAYLLSTSVFHPGNAVLHQSTLLPFVGNLVMLEHTCFWCWNTLLAASHIQKAWCKKKMSLLRCFSQPSIRFKSAWKFEYDWWCRKHMFQEVHSYWPCDVPCICSSCSELQRTLINAHWVKVLMLAQLQCARVY